MARGNSSFMPNLAADNELCDGCLREKSFVDTRREPKLPLTHLRRRQAASGTPTQADAQTLLQRVKRRLPREEGLTRVRLGGGPGYRPP